MPAVITPAADVRVSRHAAFRYRDRLDNRCPSPEQAVLDDMLHGLPRANPPRWMLLSEPGDYYVTVSDGRRPDRVYIVRDQMVVTVITREDRNPAGEDEDYGRRDHYRDGKHRPRARHPHSRRGRR